jgi:hypothetical protein
MLLIKCKNQTGEILPLFYIKKGEGNTCYFAWEIGDELIYANKEELIKSLK